MEKYGLNTQIPFYVTRKTADGIIYTWAISAWMELLVIALVWLNIVLWSGYGIYAFFRAVL